MKQHPEEVLGRVAPTVLFNMTGKFGKAAALTAMHRAAGIFMLAMRDMGGECPDDPKYYQVWGQGCGLPSGKSFLLLKNVMITCGWLVRPDRSDGHHLVVTEKGTEKALGFSDLIQSDDEVSDVP